MSASTPAHDKNAQQTLLASYETLLSRVEYMHELANAEQWTELIDQRSSCVSWILTLHLMRLPSSEK